MIISKEDIERLTEEELLGLREINLKEMQKEHQLGALELPIGIPEGCKVEQPRDHIRPEWDYVQGAACWLCNGEVRQKYTDAHGKKHYGMRFAGDARDTVSGSRGNSGQFPPDFDPGDSAYHAISDRKTDYNTGSIQAARARKGKGVTGKRGGKREGAGRPKFIKA